MEGVWTLTLRDFKTGNVTDYRVIHNDITYLGIGHFLDCLRGRSNVDPLSTTGSTWIAGGTGSATFSSWASSLSTEVSGTGNPGRIHPLTISRVDYTQLISTTFGTSVCSGNLTELGIFVKGYASGNSLANPGSALNTGVMFNKVIFAALTKDSTNTLQVDCEVKLNG